MDRKSRQLHDFSQLLQTCRTSDQLCGRDCLHRVLYAKDGFGSHADEIGCGCHFLLYLIRIRIRIQILADTNTKQKFEFRSRYIVNLKYSVIMSINLLVNNFIVDQNYYTNIE